MIQGRKPSGNLVTKDPDTFRRIETETRQCVHCQYTWEYNPFEESRARNLRGFCLNCYGFVCNRRACHEEQKLMLLEHPDRSCVSFEYYYRKRLETINKSPHFEVTPSGLIMPKDEFSNIPGLEGLKIR